MKNWLLKNRRPCALLLCVAALLTLTCCGDPAASQEEAQSTCTLSISCAAVLDCMDQLEPEKAESIPSDGAILPPTTVTFTEGETAFQLLQRYCREAGIQMEFAETPAYDSVYIEGIANLYNADCGELSGWTYQVNGESPNYGADQAVLQDGDTVTWEYVVG